jgi:diketogulonate reductase-like aldo/keto reductase
MAQEQIAEDLSALGLDAVDMLMLRDSSDCGVMRAQWKVLEGVRAAGQCRAIGVVNFCQSAFECLLKTVEIKPSVIICACPLPPVLPLS